MSSVPQRFRKRDAGCADVYIAGLPSVRQDVFESTQTCVRDFTQCHRARSVFIPVSRDGIG